MSLAHHDYRCPDCGHTLADVLVEITLGAIAGAPPCPACSQIGHDVTMDWVPQIGRMDAGSGPGFDAFETFDGKNRKVKVESLHQLRQIERESEQLYKNGEGQPIVFRAFSNDPTNKDRSALHPNFNGGEQPTEAAKKKFGATLQKAVEEPEADFGPAVNESNASALPDQ